MMAPAQSPTFATVQSRLLLIGDDGRMEAFLREHVGSAPFVHEPAVMRGILRLTQEAYDLVLLNAEPLRFKAVQAVRALRQASADVRIVLFGEAFAEVYARDALAQGAEDYLVWPIFPRDIRKKLGPQPTFKRSPPGQEENRDPVVAPAAEALPAFFETLAQAVPQGQKGLAEKAAQILKDLWQVAYVRLDLDTLETVPDDAAAVLPLSGLSTATGRLIIGPAGAKPPPTKGCLEAISAFLGTLLLLARRDEHLKRLATIDELTGSYNRRYFEHFTRHILRQSQDERTEVTLLLFDIDEFKHFNDTYGHAAGDDILRESIRLMKRCCRAHDVVARIGGDEFAVLFWDTGQKREKYSHACPQASSEALPEPRRGDRGRSHVSHPEMVQFMSNRFRRMMRTNEFKSLGPEARGVLTISGGLANFPWDGDTVEKLLAKADEALLSAKRAGKNRITLVGQPAHENT